MANKNICMCWAYLWQYFDMFKKIRTEEFGGDPNAYVSPEYAQGRLREQLGDCVIVSDLDKETEMSEREALSIYGRNWDLLKQSYEAGSKDLFKFCCKVQQISDKEWQEEKERLWAEEEAKKEEEAAEGEGSTEETPAE